MFRRDRNRAKDGIAAECEAFLAGRLVEHLLALDSPNIPGWTWTNLLAHGTVDDLRHPRIDLESVYVHDIDAWCQARAYLAREILGLTGPAGSLRHVQAVALVPLELELASRSEAHCYFPGQWVKTVLSVLAPFVRPNDRHRPTSEWPT